jgi:hypothetical protein
MWEILYCGNVCDHLGQVQGLTSEASHEVETRKSLETFRVPYFDVS